MIIGGALLVAAVVLPLLRQQGTPSWQTVWAEDGSVYAQQAIRSGPLAVLFRGYAGYLQLPPRLLIIPASWMSIRDLAWYCAIVSVVVSALLAWFVYRMSEPWIASPTVRIVLASFVVVAPSLGPENTACIVNTIWVFAAVAPWALVSRREGGRDTGLRAGVAFLAATSTPLCVVYLPLAFGWLLIRRTRSALVVTGVFCVGLLVQAAVVWSTTDTGHPFVIRNLATLRDAVGVRVFGVFLVGPRWVARLWAANWWLTAIGCTVIVVGLACLLWPKSGRWSQSLAPVLGILAVAMFVVPVWGRGTFALGLIQGGVDAQASSRFDVIPVILLGSAFALLVAPRSAAAPTRIRRIALRVFVAQVALLAIVNFSLHTTRSFESRWSAKVALVYQHHCVGASPDKVVTIPNILPSKRFPDGFFPVILPCRSLAT